MQYYYRSEEKRLRLQKHFGFLVACILLLWSSSSFGQFNIPAKPTKANPEAVYDYYNLLSIAEKTQLENKLVRYSDTTSTQIVVAIIPSTEGENIMYLGAQWGEKWGTGVPSNPVLCDQRDHQPIQQLRLMAHDGRPLDWHDLLWVDQSEMVAEAAE